MSDSAIIGPLDPEFDQFAKQFTLPPDHVLIPSGKVGFFIEVKGAKKTIVEDFEIPAMCSVVLIPVYYKHENKLVLNLKKKSHLGLLQVKLKEGMATYYDGRIATAGRSKNVPLSNDDRYKRIRTQLLPALQKKFHWKLKLKAHRYSSPMIVPNGCVVPVFIIIKTIADGKEITILDKKHQEDSETEMLQQMINFLKGSDATVVKVESL